MTNEDVENGSGKAFFTRLRAGTKAEDLGNASGAVQYTMSTLKGAQLEDKSCLTSRRIFNR